MVAKLIAALAMLILGACAQTTAPDGNYQEPGFSAYCKAHPGVGTCP